MRDLRCKNMEMRYTVLIIVIVLLIVIVGCAKATQQPVKESALFEIRNLWGEIPDLDTVDETVQVEDLDIELDEISELDF